MSTQDDTLYLRSKLATRRGRPDYGGPGGQWSSPPQFTKDGFVKWAESTRPAREGGAEKMPAEKQMPRTGGVDPLKVVDDMLGFYEQAKTYTPKVKALLRNKTIQGKIAKGKYAPQMNKIAEYMEMVGLGHMKDDHSMCQRVGGSKSFQDWAREEMKEESHGGRIGMGEGGRIGMGRVSDAKKAIHTLALRHGGADPSVMEKLQKFGMDVYNWLKANAPVTEAIMESPYLNEKNPLGATELPRKIKGYMKRVGLGEAREGKGIVSDAQTAYKGYKVAKKLGLGGGRAPSEYALFVKDFARKHPGPDLMKRAGAAWRSR